MKHYLKLLEAVAYTKNLPISMCVLVLRSVSFFVTVVSHGMFSYLVYMSHLHNSVEQIFLLFITVDSN